MSNGFFRVPQPYNEPVKAYLPGSPERAALKEELARQSGEVVDIPLIIGGREVWTERRYDIVMPHERAHVIARCCVAGEAELRMAAQAACGAAKAWGEMPFAQRAAVFLKAAELLSGPWRAKLNASTMLGQSKTAYQAEIDAVCELCDFFRYNAHFAAGIYERQPENARGVWNRVEYRPLDGFILAVTPFNFTSIGGNLPGAPALMGNCVVWKPASAAALSNYYVMRLLMEAGLPAGVVNFVPSRGAEVSRVLVADPRMAGFHFTGSTEVFSGVWSAVGANISNYRSYPRLVGETGGKDFVFAHASADPDELAAALVRGAYEYQGQKCSAASRAYIPASLWETVRQRMLALIAPLKVGDVADFTNFMGAVIDEASFSKITSYIDMAKASPDAEFICGGYDGAKGYFIRPTLIRAKKPDFPTMTTELFGPVLTVYVYEDAALEQTLALCDASTAYALTGAIFASDRAAIRHMEAALRDAAGNFYVNDKPTGAVVGQQPFGGARASGTNDKAGSELNLIRWVSPRTIKETFVPATAADYPYMSEA